jgi:competence protein ComEA
VPTPAPSLEATASARLLVHVVGRVRHPGVYEVEPGGRVADAVEAAGGLLGDACAAAINLARVVSDGEQIAVPSEQEAKSTPAGGAAAGTAAGAATPGSGAPGGLVDVNTADAALLDTLPGVGPATAQRIIADRQANGPFRGVDDLGRVSGIGPKKLEQLRSLVCAK